jgi:hypothetical protein
MKITLAFDNEEASARYEAIQASEMFEAVRELVRWLDMHLDAGTVPADPIQAARDKLFDSLVAYNVDLHGRL